MVDCTFCAGTTLLGGGVTESGRRNPVSTRNTRSASVAPLAVLFMAFALSLVVLFTPMVRGRLAQRGVLVPAIASPAAAIVRVGSDPAPTVTALVFLLVASSALGESTGWSVAGSVHAQRPYSGRGTPRGPRG
jgi:hypothetical protein